MFAATQAVKHNVTPVLTFDQLLYCEALSIIWSQTDDNDIQHIVLRLDRFHMEKSFFGSIGHLIAETGFKEVLEGVHKTNSVNYMLTGKAVSRVFMVTCWWMQFLIPCF